MLEIICVPVETGRHKSFYIPYERIFLYFSALRLFLHFLLYNSKSISGLCELWSAAVLLNMSMSSWHVKGVILCCKLSPLKIAGLPLTWVQWEILSKKENEHKSTLD